MKEFSHPSQNEKESVDIREVIRTTVTVARNEWKYVADLETEFGDDLPLLPCLRDMVGQAILNLWSTLPMRLRIRCRKVLRKKAVLLSLPGKTVTLWKYACRTMVAVYPPPFATVFSILSSRPKPWVRARGRDSRLFTRR
jgi:hypothetical protein